MNIGFIKFNLRYIFKNILFLISLIIVAFFSILFVREYELGGLSMLLPLSIYGVIGYNSLLSMLVAYMSGTEVEIMTYFSMSYFKKNLNIFISFLIISFIPLFLSLGIFLTKVPIKSLLINEVLDFFIVWLLSIILSISIGLFAGIINKGYVKYGIVFALNTIVLLGSRIAGSTLGRLINPFSDGEYSFINPYAKVLLNKYYILDKFFVIIIIILLLLIASIIVSKKNKLKLICVSLIFIILQGVVINSASKSISFGFKPRDSMVLNNEKYYIEDYSMNLKLDNKLSNECLVKLKVVDTNINKISLLLSELYVVEYVKINNEEVEFNQEEESLIIKTDQLQLKDSIDLKVKYRGDVFFTELASSNQYVSEEFINLNELDLQWYPSIRQQKPINFEIALINENKNIISNLDFIDDNVLGGQSTGVFIGKGAYKTLTEDNISVFAPDSCIDDSIIINNNNIIMESLLQYTKEEHSNCQDGIFCIHNLLSQDSLETISNQKINKIIYAPIFFGVPVDSGFYTYIWIYSDTLIVGSGF